MACAPANAEVVAFGLVESSSQNLISYNNPSAGTFTNFGDGFEIYQRGVSTSIPFSVLDDSLSIFPEDTLGIIQEANLDTFFGVTDTENPDNTGPISATWTFDLGFANDLGIFIDMGALGDFESASNSFSWTVSIDDGPKHIVFFSTVDENTS